MMLPRAGTSYGFINSPSPSILGGIMKGDEAAKEKGMRIIVGCIVLGVLIAVGPSIITWLTQVDISNPSGLPEQLHKILDQLYTAMKVLGAFLMAFGLIYGGYQYSRR